MLDSKDIEALEAMFDKRITRSENVIMTELDRVQDNLQEQINKLRQEVKEGSQVGVLLSIIDDLRRRVEELERRSA